MYDEGIRVGAISHTKDGTAYFFGYGVYEGNFIPFEEWGPEDSEGDPGPGGMMGDAVVKLKMKNPRIRLDTKVGV